MFKSELMKLIKNENYKKIEEELPSECQGQGFYYKNKKNWDELSDDEICYAPELIEPTESESYYTKQDFIDLAGEQAEELFNAVDWQHPSSLFYEWESEREEEDN